MRQAFDIWDVFTDRPFSGNPLAIVQDADGLDAAAMQMLARQFNLSETIFLLRPHDPVNTARVRIFFPTAEIPFAGHPLIGAALLLADGRDTDLRIETEAGLVPVAIRDSRARLTAPRLPAAVGPVPPDADLAAAVGLDAAQIGFARHRPAIWEGGPTFLFLPVIDLAALAAARPAGAVWDALVQATGVPAVYLYTPVDGGFRARMFNPGKGLPEDPATGSASALLAAQLLAAGDVGEGWTERILHQGVEMGRPSRIDLSVQVADGRVRRIDIAGRAVKMADGRIRRPHPTKET